jgi:NUMOD3 motif
MIYLYKKTHNITGLQYLGKTTQNPFSYKGSGIYWGAHLRKHGDNVTTEILKECTTKEEVRYWGLYFSKLWDVVNSDEWANLTEESGSGGNNGHVWTVEERLAVSVRNKGKSPVSKGKTYLELYGEIKAKEKIEKLQKTWSSKPKKEKAPNKFPNRAGLTFEEIFGKERAADIKARQSKNLSGENNPRFGKPGTFTGKKHSEDTLKKMRQPTGKQKNPREKVVCPHCGTVSDSSNAKRWHFDNCKLNPLKQ